MTHREGRKDALVPHVSTVAAIVLATAILSAYPAVAGEAVSHTIDVNGVTRTYLLYVPPWQSGKRLPAFVLMHGSGSTDVQQERYSDFDAFAQAHGLVVMYPQGIDKHWNDGRVIGHESMADDIGFMKAMLAEVTAQGLIDSKRVYAAGISNGGFMAQHMACVMPDALAGIAVVAATQPVDAACPSARPMPVIFFHGTADKFVPFKWRPDRSTIRQPRHCAEQCAGGRDLAEAQRLWRGDSNADPRQGRERSDAGNGRDLFVSGRARAGKCDRAGRRTHLAGRSSGVAGHENPRTGHGQYKRQRHDVELLPVAGCEVSDGRTVELLSDLSALLCAPAVRAALRDDALLQALL